jgi:NAD(P)-dependent dehydrogenase (short-subunit alcohol dehydrogenase family)
MKVILIGASGTIGKAVSQALSVRHEVVGASRSSGTHRVDISSKDSIRRLFEAVGACDAVICAAGQARFGPLEKLSDEDFEFSQHNKLMGQVNVVRIGAQFVRDGGSLTVTSGVLASEPMPGSGAISLVNAGLEGFVRAAALELPRGVRVNVVSPPWVSETLVALGRDGSSGMPAAAVAAAYVGSAEGRETGKVIDARTFRR